MGWESFQANLESSSCGRSFSLALAQQFILLYLTPSELLGQLLPRTEQFPLCTQLLAKPDQACTGGFCQDRSPIVEPVPQNSKGTV